jgi:hypothetical protein
LNAASSRDKRAARRLEVQTKLNVVQGQDGWAVCVSVGGSVRSFCIGFHVNAAGEMMLRLSS